MKLDLEDCQLSQHIWSNRVWKTFGIGTTGTLHQQPTGQAGSKTPLVAFYGITCYVDHCAFFFFFHFFEQLYRAARRAWVLKVLLLCQQWLILLLHSRTAASVTFTLHYQSWGFQQSGSCE